MMKDFQLLSGIEFWSSLPYIP